jgi:hypothetical protein
VLPGRRRTSLTAALVALLTAAAVSALAASAAAPSRDSRPTAQPQPRYLEPVGRLVQHGYLPFPALLGDTGTVGVPRGTAPAPAHPDPAVAAQQEPAIAPFRGATGTLTPAGIATLALEHGCAPAAAATATAIAMAESGGSPAAQGDIGLMSDVWDWSAGLWQIRGLRAERGSGGLRDSIANQDADTNAAAMFVVSRGCTDWTPWSTYNSGVYEQFLPIAEEAVRYVMAYYSAHGGHYPPVGAPDATASIPVPSAAAPRPSTARTAPPTDHRTAAPRRARSSAPHRAPPAPGRQPGGPASRPARTSTAQPAPSATRVSLPMPAPTLPTKSLRVPTPSVTLPIPTPSLTVPTLPGLP